MAAGAVGAGILLFSGSSAPAMGDLVIKGSVTAGPVSSGVRLFAYDTQGKLLGTADIQSDGSFSITFTSAPPNGLPINVIHSTS
jgi:hypothetical protein